MACVLLFSTIGIVFVKSGVARAGTVYASEDVFASVGNGTVNVYDPTTGDMIGNPLVDTSGDQYTVGSAFDSSGDFYVADLPYSGQVSEFAPDGTSLGAFATGLNSPESLVFDSSGNLYVGNQLTPYIDEFNPSGQQIATIGPVATELYGADWIDLASDQCTFYYTTEGTDILRYNQCTNMQEPNFNQVPLTSGQRAFEVRILADGDVLVADSTNDYLLNSNGDVIQTYSCASLPGCEGQLFAIAVDPNGTDFWTGDSYSGLIWEVDIATGAVVQTINTDSGLLYGLSVKDELRVAQAPTVVSATPTALSSPTTSTSTIEVGQPVTVSSQLTDTSTNPATPISGESVTFTLNGTETCTATTDSNGNASCQITPTEPSGTYTLSASFAGGSTSSSSTSSSTPPNGSSSTSTPLIVSPDTTNVTYTGPTNLTNGQPVTLTGTITTDTPTADTPLPTKEVTFTIGSGPTAQSCTTDPATDVNGSVSCTISAVDQPTSNVTITSSFAGDAYDTPATSTPAQALVTEPTSLTVNPCPVSSGCDYADQTTVTATLMDTNMNVPVANEPIQFNLDGQTCSGTTNSSGVASCPITPDEMANTYTLNASFAGDSTLPLQLANSSGSSPFVVSLEESWLTYTGGTIAQNGQPLTVSGVLSTDDPTLGTGIAGRTVNFVLGSGSSAQPCSGTTNSAGVASCVINVTGQPSGPIPVTDTFTSDGYYRPASASGTVNLPEGTQLTITSSGPGPYGGSTPVSATLINTYTNQPVSGQTVTLEVNGTPSESCSATTNAQGVASCNLTPTSPSGTYSFTATFPGNTSTTPQLNSTSASGSFTVTPAPTSFTYTGVTTLVNGSSATISGTLTTSEPSNGTDLGGQPVTLTIGSGSSAQSCTGTTNANGYVSCTINTVNQTSGTVGVTATYGGNTYYGGSTGSETSVPVYTPTKLTVNPGTSDYNDVGSLSATLTNALTGSGIGGETVTLTLPGSPPCSGTTAANGTVSCSVTPTEPAGNYTITGSFGGDSAAAPQLLSSTGSNIYVVTHEETAITYTGTGIAVSGMPFTLSSNLTTDGNPLSGRTVVMTLGSGTTTQSCTGVTNASGNASCVITDVNQVAGTVPITVDFVGDAWYRPSSAAATETTASLPGSTTSGTANGAFTIGDVSAGAPTLGTLVNFWGAQFWKNNVFSGVVNAPASMKSYLDDAPTLACGINWTTDPGNSGHPPASVPVNMVVVVSSKEWQSGSNELGNVVHLVVVSVQPGYAGDPGHAGWGTIIGTIC